MLPNITSKENNDSSDEEDLTERRQMPPKQSKKEVLNFSHNEWAKIGAIIDILKPLKLATKKAEERNTSLGIVIPLLKLIQHDLILRPVTNEFPEVRKAIVDKVLSGVGTWPKQFDLAIATILDPKFKNLMFSMSEDPQKQVLENTENLNDYAAKIWSIVRILHGTGNVSADLENVSLNAEVDMFDRILDNTNGNLSPTEIDTEIKFKTVCFKR
jgi:hypothetical protein